MEIAGYLASVLIGISLGLIGGGGSILTVPVLVYLFGIDAGHATAYSLFVVGLTSLVGSVSYFRRGQAEPLTALSFGLPSIVAVFLTRTFLIPAIPDILIKSDGFSLSKNTALMLLFAVLMVAASYSMIRKPAPAAADENRNKSMVPVQGFFVGVLTGLIGAGGGFLIIPALVNFLRMPMKTAIGTSLAIIAVNSLSGFAFSLSNLAVEWRLLLTVSGIAIAGIVIGSTISKKIDGKKLKPAFGWFVLAMGSYIIIRETLLR